MASERVSSGRIAVKDKILQPDQFANVMQMAKSQTNRKRVLRIGVHSAPPILDEARLESERFAGQYFNTAILKSYESGYDSRAYQFHQDPCQYIGRIVMISLNNRATLEVRYGGDIESVTCLPNRAIMIDARTEHRVTPPIDEGNRYLLTFALDQGFRTGW